MHNRPLVCFLRVALLAAFINALAPTISYFVALSEGKQVVEICTSFGLKKVVIDTGSESHPSHQEQSVYCQFCLASQSAVAFKLPPAVPQPPLANFAAPRSEQQFAVDARRRWREGRPRAPPVLSV